MKSVASSNLADFVTAVVSQSPHPHDDAPPDILIFCHGSFLHNFAYTGYSRTLTVSQIDALHRVNIIANASYTDLFARFQKLWSVPRDSERKRTVLAFFDLLTEFPGHARENAPRVNLVLYMLSRLGSHRANYGVDVIVNLPTEAPTRSSLGPGLENGAIDGRCEDSRFYVCSDMLKLASKWTPVVGLESDTSP